MVKDEILEETGPAINKDQPVHLCFIHFYDKIVKNMAGICNGITISVTRTFLLNIYFEGENTQFETVINYDTPEQHVHVLYPSYTQPLYSKTGVYRGIYISYFALKHKLWVLFRTASMRLFYSVPTIYVSSKYKKNIKSFHLK